MNKDQRKEITTYCADTNVKEFNFNKALEECTEFMETLIKFQTKADSNPKKPTKEHVLEEYTHIVIRGLIAVKTLYPDLSLEEVLIKCDKYSDLKFESLLKWKKEGKYKNGL